MTLRPNTDAFKIFVVICSSIALGAGIGGLMVTQDNKDNPRPGQPVNTASPVTAAKPDTPPPVRVRAEQARHRPRADQYVTGAYSCVSVVVTNRTDGQVLAGVEYMTITGTDGTKRVTSPNVDSRELVTVTLSPGENARGTACAEGKFTPYTLSFESGSDIYRTQVSAPTQK